MSDLSKHLAGILRCEPMQLLNPARIVIQDNEFTKAFPDGVFLVRTEFASVLSLGARPYTLLAPVFHKMKLGSRLTLAHVKELLSDRKKTGAHYAFSYSDSALNPGKEHEMQALGNVQSQQESDGGLALFQENILIHQAVSKLSGDELKIPDFDLPDHWEIGWKKGRKFELGSYQKEALVQFELVDLLL